MAGPVYYVENYKGQNDAFPEYLDGKLIYVQKRFVAIPLDATPGGDVSKFDPSKMVMTAVTYDELYQSSLSLYARMGIVPNTFHAAATRDLAALKYVAEARGKP